MLTCPEVPGQVLLRLSGELEGAGQETLRAHLESCPPCRTEAGSLEESWQAFRRPPLPQAAALRPSLPRAGTRPLAWTAAAAGLLLVLSLGWRMQPRQTPPMPVPSLFTPYAAQVDREMQSLSHRCEESWRDLSRAEGRLDLDLDSLSGRITTLSKEITPESTATE